MNLVVSSTGRWAVSTRPTGEVLVARCDAGEISVVRFGAGPGENVEIERQLHDLIEASRQSATRAPAAGPIPALLHHVLARLLASEVPNSGGALIVFDDGRDATVATLGELDARLQLDGSDAHLPWVRVRDRSGHEARAYPVPLDRSSVFHLHWPLNREPGVPTIDIEARWPVTLGDSPRETRPETSDVPLPALPGGSGRVPSYAQDDRADEARVEGLIEEKEGFLQWFDRMRGRRSQGSDDDRAVSERIPPSPEPEWLTSATVDPITANPHPESSIPHGADAVNARTAHELIPERVLHPSRFEDARAQTETTAPFASPAHDSAPAIDHAPQPPRVSPTPRRIEWPEPERLEVPVWKKPWAWGVLAGALLCGAVLVASLGNRTTPSGRSLFATFGPHFTATLNSRPPGAWIAIDGKDTGRLTPATLELTPGEHQVTMTVAGRGSATMPVRGERNTRTSIDAALYGGVRVNSADPRIPISVSLDGLDRGYAPVTLEDLLPGPHEIRYGAPGMDPWSETFEVRVGQTLDLVARPFTMPDNGVIEVRSTMAIDGAAEPLKGATVYIDGESRGTTPVQLDLPHGPHSIRVAYRGEELPVQVIDLPGGNHRFADFAFGLGVEAPPRMVQTSPPGPISREVPVVISSAITGIAEVELKEMWLHVRSPERTWKRYEMTLLRAAGGVVGVAIFPPTMIEPDGGVTYYTSAVMQIGDEYYTELRTGRPAPKAAPRPARPRAAVAPSDPTPPATPAAGAETP